MNTRFLLPFLSILFYQFHLLAQCPLNVNAGTDQTVCFPGGNVTLSGTVTGPSVGAVWSPSTGLSNPNSLTTTASVFSTTTYTLTGQAVDQSINLITNGNFEAGNVGFSSAYTYSPNDLWPEGIYTVTNNPTSVHPNFASCGDHTSSGGQMMVVNGSATPNISIWCQTIPVSPNTTYAFGAWVASVISTSPAQLQFSINGQLLGSIFSASPTTCLWEEFYEVWNSGGAASATICIVNQNTQPSGNDFAIDDITFNPVCEVTDEVTIEVIQVNAFLPPFEFLPCNANGTTGIMLDGSSASSGPNITYQWTTTNGNIIAGATTTMPTVNAPGNYTLTVTYNNGFTSCTATASMDVVPDPNVPFANAVVFDEINCNNLTATINGLGSTEGPNIFYQWTTSNGEIVLGENTLEPVVGSAGTYLLTVTNLDNGCTATASAEVTENLEEPTALAEAPDEINCINTSVSISGEGSSEGGNFSYQWTTNNGNILSGETTLEPEVNGAGTYTLLVTNNSNGCTAEAETTVTENTTEPIAEIADADPLSCLITSLMLDGTNSSNGGSFTYQWTTINGNIESGESTLEPEINAEGTYTLTVTDEVNGCTANAEITVIADLDPPIADILPPNSLNCTMTSIVLDGTNSSQGNEFTLEWTTPNGNFVNNENTLTPEVNAAGTYTLTITNNTNGCTADASEEVMGDNGLPVANIAPTNELNCEILNLELDGSNSSQGSDFLYNWTTNNGNIVNGASTLMPLVDLPGTYVLTVTNTFNDCSITASITVLQNIALPNADAGLPSEINCFNLTQVLNGTNSSQGNEFSYEWTSNDGNILNGENSLTPEVNEAGTYTLTISNNNNQCTATAEVEIGENLTDPEAQIEDPNILNCNFPSFQLDASNSTEGNDIFYEWTTPNGNILSGENSLMPEINEAGDYEILVTNNLNGCTATAQVNVAENFASPLANAGQPFQLDCNLPMGSLDGSGSSQGTNFTYEWTTANGTIANGEMTLSPQVNEGGIYNLLVTDTINGCTATASVTIDQDENIPIAEALVTETLTCEILDLNINGSNSTQGNGITFEWTTTDGNFIANENTLMPTINEPGTYILTIFDSNNNCEATTSVEVLQDLTPPNVEAGSNIVLDCENPEAILDPTGSSIGTNFDFEWTTLNGNFSNNVNTLNPEVDTEGTYTLLITNLDNGCTASDVVIIAEDFENPNIEILPPDTLNCAVFSASLNGGNSSQGIDFQYLWTTSNGNITSGETTLLAEANQPGDYELLITNTENGCTATASIEVNQDIELPVADAGESMELNCYFPILTLQGSASTGNLFNYIWTSQNGNILQNETTLTPEIDQLGTYQLLVTNIENHCTATATVEITEDIEPPLVETGTGFTLSCSVTEATLDGSNSSIGNNFEYLWTTQNGNILSGETTPSPDINAPGNYLLTLTNINNGCTASDEVEIEQDANAPTASILLPETLTCTTISTTLDGSPSSQGAAFSYLWTTQNGNITAGATTLNPNINAPGNYLLAVTNLDNNCETLASIQVVQDITPPITEAGEFNELTCIVTALNLDGTGSDVGNIFTYEWTTLDGNILNNATTLSPEIDAPGSYELMVLNTENGCTSTDFVNITQNIAPPDAVANVNEDLTCVTSSLVVDGDGSSIGTNFNYLWSTTNGNIVSNETTLNANVDEIGTYQILVTNTQNGCTAIDQVEVFENINLPNAVANVTQELNCETASVLVDGNGSSAGLNFSYTWSTNNGNILSDPSQLTIEVNETGFYQILVTNTQNGCTATNQVEVSENTTPPIATIALPETLTCTILSILLNGNNSSQGNQFEYLWTTPNGNIITGETTLTPEVKAVGTYLLTITNTENGCTETTSIEVSQDIELPNAEAGEGFVLNCFEDIQFLDGSTSQTGSNISYQWTTDDGILETGNTSTTPGISSGGTYQLLVTNTENGCTKTDAVTITEDVPTAEFSLTQPPCFGDRGSIIFDNLQGGTTPYIFSLDGGNTFGNQSTFTNLNPNIYDLVVQDANGCEYRETQVIIQPNKLQISLEAEVALELGDSYQILTQINIPEASISEITWTPTETLDCGDCLNPIATPVGNTQYQIKVTTENGCTENAPILLTVNRNPKVYIPNAFSPNGDGENEVFMIYAKDESVTEIKTFMVFDRWGESVFTDSNFQPNNPAHGWNGKYREQALKPSVFAYFALIEMIDGEIRLFKGDVTLVH